MIPPVSFSLVQLDYVARRKLIFNVYENECLVMQLDKTGSYIDESYSDLFTLSKSSLVIRCLFCSHLGLKLMIILIVD